LFADNELTEVAAKAGRAHYVKRVVLRHDWIGEHDRADQTFQRSQRYFAEDRRTFCRRMGLPEPPPEVAAPPPAPAAKARTVDVPRTGERFLLLTDEGQVTPAFRGLLDAGWRGVLVSPAAGDGGPHVVA